MLQHRSTHSLNPFQSCMPDWNPEELLPGPVMITETSCESAHTWRESFVEEALTITLWMEELEIVDCCKVDEHEDELIENEIMENLVHHGEKVVV